MKIIRILCVLFTVAVAQSGWAGSYQSTDMAYNALARSENLRLQYPGYVIAIEKRPRSDVGVCRNAGVCGYDEDVYDGDVDGCGDAGVCFKVPDPMRLNNEELKNKHFNSVTNDPEINFVTHAFKFPGHDERGLGKWGKHENPYSPYKFDSDDSDGSVLNYAHTKLDYGQESLVLSSLRADLKEELAKEKVDEDGERYKYTHVFFVARGWNNDQHIAIAAINKWLRNLSDAANKDGQVFRPIVVALTWPSAWGSRNDSFVQRSSGFLTSIFNKANDADEIGYTTGNYILNEIIRPLRDQRFKNIKIVCIGHSLGARLVATSLISSRFLTNRPELEPVDFYFGLQPAFSVNRFSEKGFFSGGGLEKASYADLAKNSKKSVMTSSKCDTANVFSLGSSGAKYVGGRWGLSKARKLQKKGEKITVVTLNIGDEYKDCKEKPPSDIPLDKALEYKEYPDGSVIIVDATSIVKKHGDDTVMPIGTMMMNFLFHGE